MLGSLQTWHAQTCTAIWHWNTGCKSQTRPLTHLHFHPAWEPLFRPAFVGDQKAYRKHAELSPLPVCPRCTPTHFLCATQLGRHFDLRLSTQYTLYLNLQNNPNQKLKVIPVTRVGPSGIRLNTDAVESQSVLEKNLRCQSAGDYLRKKRTHDVWEMVSARAAPISPRKKNDLLCMWHFALNSRSLANLISLNTTHSVRPSLFFFFPPSLLT